METISGSGVCVLRKRTRACTLECCKSGEVWKREVCFELNKEVVFCSACLVSTGRINENKLPLFNHGLLHLALGGREGGGSRNVTWRFALQVFIFV